MSLTALRLGRRGVRRPVAVTVSTRNFEPREKHWNFECPYPIKTKFNYDHIWPYDDNRDRIWFDGAVFAHNDHLEKHYLGYMWWARPEFKQPNPSFVGYYGPYWPAHLGWHQTFLKRRTKEPADYSKGGGTFLHHWIRRKHDERGLDWYYPCGQPAQHNVKWVVWAYLLTCVTAIYRLCKEHYKTSAIAEKPEPEWDPKPNLPFFLYEANGVRTPNIF